MNDSVYHVGQVLYVILRKEARVYPVQCVEVITKKTFEGEIITYMVRSGIDPEAKVLITDIDGEIFDSAEKAKNTLVERAGTSINRLVSTAIQKAKEWYKAPTQESFNDDSISILKKGVTNQQMTEAQTLGQELMKEAEGATLIELPGGRKAKVRQVKLPDVLKN